MKPSAHLPNGIFVTGTDTGVGKTHVTAHLLAELRRRGINAAGFKPIACGNDGRRDAIRYRAIMNNDVPLRLVNPVYLRRPLSPHIAARLEKRSIALDQIADAYHQLAAQYDLVLVEGAGGILVPVTDSVYMADLARLLDLPAIVVARLGLGTINHTLLTVQTARIAGLPLLGIVLNDTTGTRTLAARTNVTEIPRLTGVPLLGVMPHGEHPRPAAIRAICNAFLHQFSR
jgi:dethiobiotin synthetase